MLKSGCLLEMIGTKIKLPETSMYGMMILIVFLAADVAKGWEFYGFINNLEDNLGVSVDVLTYEEVQ